MVKGHDHVHIKKFDYKDKDTSVARSAQIGECVVIGRGCKINENVFINNTIIGQNCYIGENVHIVDSHLMDGCRIEHGASVIGSIIASECVVGPKAILSEGCILSFGTKIGAGMKLANNTRISLQCQDEDCKVSDDFEYVGNDGRGYVWKEVDDDIVVENSLSSKFLLQGQSIGNSEIERWRTKRWHTVNIPHEEDSDSDNDDYDDNKDTNDNNNVAFVTEDNLKRTDTDRQKANATNTTTSKTNEETFDSVVKDMLYAGFEEGKSPLNVVLEIKGYKFAQNKTFGACVHASVGPLLDICCKGSTDQTVIIKNIVKLFKDGGGWCYAILSALLQDVDDQLTVIECVEDWILTPRDGIQVSPSFLRYVLQTLHGSGIAI